MSLTLSRYAHNSPYLHSPAPASTRTHDHGPEMLSSESAFTNQNGVAFRYNTSHIQQSYVNISPRYRRTSMKSFYFARLLFLRLQCYLFNYRVPGSTIRSSVRHRYCGSVFHQLVVPFLFPRAGIHTCTCSRRGVITAMILITPGCCSILESCSAEQRFART